MMNTETSLPIMVEQLAAALFHGCHLPHGHNLVGILGDGTELDNQTALETWVLRQLTRPSRRLATTLINGLVDALQDEMERTEVQRWN